MEKLLVTGYSGFVSQHLLHYLKTEGADIEVLGIDKSYPDFNVKDSESLKCRFKQVDLLDKTCLRKVVYTYQPDYVLHLASYSSVGYSWRKPLVSFQNNMNIFLNLLEVVREVSPFARVISVGSSEEYGDYSADDMPLKEDYKLNPLNPYAVARVSQEQLSRVYCYGYGLNIVMTRSFNHIGPMQKEIFVISSFAKQLVEIQKGLKEENKIVVGDTSVIRDFLDVRDVVDAYYKIFKHGELGEVYNICSGKGVSLHEIIDVMCNILNIQVTIEKDEKLIRPNDNRIVIGDNKKLNEKTGWKPRIGLRKSIEDIIEYWKMKIQ